MRLGILLVSISWLAVCARGADVCNPTDLQGSYAFQLTGETTISGQAQPSVTLGSLVFDSEGGVSGTSSVKFAGLLLGNPVTGSYEAKTDCSVTWQLQDDSGAYQHFSGFASPGGGSVQFRQTDAGGPDGGVLERNAAQECKAADLRAKYTFTISGATIPMTDGGSSGKVSAKGTIEAKGGAAFHLSLDGKPPYTTDVTVSVESDCSVEMGFALPAESGEGAGPVNLRGVLVDGYKQILAIQTDPGAVVSARFTAERPAAGPQSAPVQIPFR